jgi:hypothetical protein
VIALFTPDIQGVCWFNSVKSLFATLNVQERILPIVAMADRHCDLAAVEKATDTHFAVTLPYVREFRQEGADVGTTYAAMRYLRGIKKLHALLKGADGK